MSTQQSDTLIGPSVDPPPFARSHAAAPRGEFDVLPTATWRPLIQQICAAWGVDPVRIEAMMLLESAGKDLEPNGAGAVGLMQIIPGVWPELCAVVCAAHGVPNAMSSWRRPEINIEIGVRELKWWIEATCAGDADGGSCAYFSGHCIPNGAKDDFGTSDSQYVDTVRQNMDLVRNDTGHGTLGVTRFNDGDRITVFDGPLNLRKLGNLQAQVLASLPAGTTMTVTGGPVTHDGHVWYRVDVAAGPGKGWVAGEYCRLAQEATP